MKINRLALIERIDARIDAGRAAHEERHQRAVSEYAAEIEEWRAKQAPQLLENLRALTERLRKGRTVTRGHIADATGDRYGRVSLVFDGSNEPPKHKEYVPPAELSSLRNFLTTITDDEVSHSTLRDMGWRNLAGLLR